MGITEKQLLKQRIIMLLRTHGIQSVNWLIPRVMKSKGYLYDIMHELLKEKKIVKVKAKVDNHKRQTFWMERKDYKDRGIPDMIQFECIVEE